MLSPLYHFFCCVYKYTCSCCLFFCENKQVLDEATDSVTCVQVSDHEILTGSADGKIRRYDLRVGKLFADLIGSKFKIYQHEVII